MLSADGFKTTKHIGKNIWCTISCKYSMAIIRICKKLKIESLKNKNTNINKLNAWHWIYDSIGSGRKRGTTKEIISSTGTSICFKCGIWKKDQQHL